MTFKSTHKSWMNIFKLNYRARIIWTLQLYTFQCDVKLWRQCVVTACVELRSLLTHCVSSLRARACGFLESVGSWVKLTLSLDSKQVTAFLKQGHIQIRLTNWYNVIFNSFKVVRMSFSAVGTDRWSSLRTKLSSRGVWRLNSTYF
jgi:hypothetical protein